MWQLAAALITLDLSRSSLHDRRRAFLQASGRRERRTMWRPDCIRAPLSVSESWSKAIRNISARRAKSKMGTCRVHGILEGNSPRIMI